MTRQDDRPQPLPPDLYTQEYFLSACEGYEEFLQTQGEHLSRRLAAAFEHATVEPGMRVLDVGCGRGEILRHCARLGAEVYGVDYAPVAMQLAGELVRQETGRRPGLYRCDAKHLPFPSAAFDRVLMFDIVEHLHPWELDQALRDAQRVLRPGGKLIVHTAPNRWYDVYAYPFVRLVRIVMGQGAAYPANPRALNVAANVDVHVNEQDLLSMRRYLLRAGFHGVRVWLDSPPQHRQENPLFRLLRHAAFEWPPLRWFFEREVFAVAEK
jgi:cyclopropane fatty-acyl-phospholipid synthase-like methyltransferase